MTPSRFFIGPTTHLVAAILLLIVPITTRAVNSCNAGIEYSCSSTDFSATSNIFFHVNRTESNADYSNYNVTFTWHWGETNTTQPSQAYEFDKPYGFANTYQYTKEGYYLVGYTVTFEDDAAAGCSGQSYSKLRVLKMERTPNACKFNAETPNPTMSPTLSAGPTVSSSPTAPPVMENGVGGSSFGGVQLVIFVASLVAAVRGSSLFV